MFMYQQFLRNPDVTKGRRRLKGQKAVNNGINCGSYIFFPFVLLNETIIELVVALVDLFERKVRLSCTMCKKHNCYFLYICICTQRFATFKTPLDESEMSKISFKSIKSFQMEGPNHWPNVTTFEEAEVPMTFLKILHINYMHKNLYLIFGESLESDCLAF